MANTAQIVIGIDPGYDRLGWAVGTVITAQQVKILGYGCVLTRKEQDIFERYAQLQTELDDVLEKFSPTDAAIESLFFSKNQKTVMRVSEVRGVIVQCLLQHGCTIAEYTPLQIKQAVTGFGKAEKSAVDKMVRLQLKLTEPKIIDDTMDALAILLTHSTQLNLRGKLQ